LTGFHHEINSRIATVRENLRQAVQSDEPFLVDVHVGELESLARLAADHGIAVDGLPETLARHGVTTPAAGLTGLPATGPIDLRLAERASAFPPAR
jgi:hypothetical protein